MKKILSSSVCLLLVIILSANNNVTVKGKIINPKGEEAKVTYVKNKITHAPEKLGVSKLDNEGNFEITFTLEKPLMAVFHHGDEIAELYLCPEDDLFLTLDTKLFDETLKFTGKGAEFNNFIIQELLREEKEINFSELFIKPYKEFVANIDKQKDQSSKILSKFKSKYKNPDANAINFFKIREYDIIYNWAGMKLNYSKLNVAFTKADKSPELPSDFYNFLNDVSIDNPSASLSDYYNNFLQSYFNYRANERLKKDTTLKGEKRFDFQFKLAQNELSGETRDIYWGTLLDNALSHLDELSLMENMLEKYNNVSGNADAKKYLNEKYEKIKKLTKGNIAPTFTYKNLDGKEVSLSDFKGKIVYLDVWASWCGPCRSEIPHAKKLKEDFEGKEVVFLNVSVDDNEEAWRKIIEEKEIGGIHLITDKGWNTSITKDYNIDGIPRYVLIDKQGNIVSSNAKRPSMGIKKDIEELLN